MVRTPTARLLRSQARDLPITPSLPSVGASRRCCANVSTSDFVVGTATFP